MTNKIDRKYPMFKLLKEFLTDYMIDIRNSSINTVDLYRNVLCMFLNFMAGEKKCSFLELDYGIFSTAQVKSFMSYLKNTRGCSISTCNTYFVVLRSFLTYASGRDISLLQLTSELKDIPLAKAEADLTVRHFTVEALHAMLKIPDRSESRGRRNFLILFMLYDTACRISELLELKTSDVIIDTPHPYMIIHGKGGKKREIPISKTCCSYLKDYLEERNPTRNPRLYLFLSDRAENNIPISSNTVRKIITSAADNARKDCKDIPQEVSPHMFRHSRAIHLYERGVPIAMIQQLLGHSDIATTYIYAYASREMKREALEHSTSENLPSCIGTIKTKFNADFRDEEEALIYFGLKS